MHDRISVNPDIHLGKPCVAGTRITVRDVLELVLDGATVEEIRGDCYPALTPEDIRACVEYTLDVISRQAPRAAAA